MDYYKRLYKGQIQLYTEEKFDLYIFLKFQIHISNKFLELNGIDSDLIINIDGHDKKSNEVNENDFIRLCNSAKFLFNTDISFTPVFIERMKQTLKVSEITFYLDLSIKKYFDLDTSMTEKERNEFSEMIRQKILEDWNIELI